MAFTDIQNKVGQTQMANQILLAERKIPPQEEGEGTLDYRKRISGGTYKNKPNKNNPFAGMSDEEQRVEALKRQEALNKKRAEEKLDQDPELNKQREDMRQGDYLEDPEQPFNINTLLQIGGAAGSMIPFMGGNILKMLISPNAMAMDFKDTGLSDGGFISTDKPHIYINRGAEAYILMPDGDFRFDGMYDPKRHGNAFPGLGLVQRNNDTKMAKLPHTPPTEKMVVGKKLMDSPLRFRTDDQREQYMNDFSRGFRYDGT